MTRSGFSHWLALMLLVFAGYSIHADVRSEQKTKVQFGGMLGGVVNLFGGRAAKEGVTTAIAVKGDRKASTNDATSDIVDLNEEVIYKVDLRRKTYKVTTFAELRRQMEEARRKAEESARKQQAKDKPAERDSNAKEMDVDFEVKDTGQKKTVNGFDTHEAVMTITVREKGKKLEDSGGLVLTADMWLTPTIAAMQEIAAFDARYAQKLQGPMVAGASPEEMGAMMASYPSMKDALAKMAAEGSKLQGTPIMTTTTFDVVKSADQVAQEAKPADDDKSKDAGVGGLLGGLARRAAQKRSSGDQADKTRSTFMTSTTEVLKIATEVAATDVAVPAGFKESK